PGAAALGPAAPGAAPSGPAAVAAAATPGAAAAGASSRFAPVPGPYGVEAMNLDWVDKDRNRPVPVRVYFPRREPGPFPVVVFSSGLGAGRASLEFLGRHLASHGFISVHVQHQGTDAQTFKAGGREALVKAARGREAALTRLLDLVFALDQVGALAASSPVLRGRVDLAAVAVGGSNLGAWTALSAAGLAFTGKDGEESSLPDPRVKAALLFAPPPVQGVQRARLRFEHVKVPCLHFIDASGSGKEGGENDRQPAARRVAFDSISGVDQVLVTAIAAPGAPGGGQAADAGRGARRSAPGREAALQGPLEAISAAFLEAYLRHDAAARQWLAGGGLAAWLGDRFRVEAHAR
ncbi:MAG TPA: hypothetical protein VE075_06910, partial [Thermoanaerobaculia bacterium]|nr:hypothetical protein [Thermoanaerobaculia bacterium]